MSKRGYLSEHAIVLVVVFSLVCSMFGGHATRHATLEMVTVVV